MAATASETNAETQEAGESHGAHPTPKLYVEVAVTLGVLTAMEISTFYIDFGFMFIPILLVLMAIKFAMVAGFFMHLKYDTRLFSRFMGAGLAGAIVLYSVVLLAFSTKQVGG